VSGLRDAATPEPARLSRRSASVEETERIAETLAPVLSAGDVIVLTGPLGAGKTRFVTGLARGVAAKARVRSPSFTLVNEYRGATALLLHLDLYRIEPMDVPGLGLEEELERGTLVVEWGEKLPGSLRAEALEIVFEVTGPDERVLSASASAGRGLELLEAWRERAAERR
jgi:tRNA threonylcarbamoyladenosine biosynthesis protein TsaE